MGRLTKRIADEATLNGTGDVPCKTICDRMYKYDNPCDMCPINEAINKLAHYEDLEEAGRLIELPCAVGDTVWEIASIYFFDDKEPTHSIHSTSFTLVDLSGIGEWCFLTKEEAERKLKELEGDKE